MNKISFFVPPFNNNTSNQQQHNNQHRKQKLTLLHQNIAGILNKLDFFEVTISELTKEMGVIDFICLSETFIQSGHESNLKLTNYKLAANYSRSNKKRGGTCILVKEGLTFSPLKITSEISSDYSFECCGIRVPSHNLILVCVYRIPDSDTVIF